MNRGRSPMKIRPKPETIQESVPPRLRTGHARTNSLSKPVEGLNRRKDELQSQFPVGIRQQSESPKVRELPPTDRGSSLTGKREKSNVPVLSRTNSEKKLVPELSRTNSGQYNNNNDRTRNFMMPTRSFNAKTQKPTDLKDEKVKKKSELDTGVTKQKSEGFCAKTCRNPYCSLNHNTPTPPKTFSYLKARSRSPSIDSQNSPRNLRRLNSIDKRNLNFLGSSTQNREEGLRKSVGTKKRRGKEEIEVEKNVIETSCHEEHNEKVREEIKHEEVETKFENLSESDETLLEIEESEVNKKYETETRNDKNLKKHEDEMEILIEENSEKHEDEMEIPNEETLEKYEDVNVYISEIEIERNANNSTPSSETNEEIYENENLEKEGVIDESLTGIEGNETNEMKNSFSLKTIHEDENSEKHEVIDTKYEEISDLFFLSGSNDEAEMESNLHDISIEDELSKLNEPTRFELESFGTKLNYGDFQNQEQNKVNSVIPIIKNVIVNKPKETDEDSTEQNKVNSVIPIIEDVIVDKSKKTEENSTEQNKVNAVIPIIKDVIVNKPKEMGEDSTRDDEGKEEQTMEPKKKLNKWLVDYALQKLIKKLKSNEKLNEVNKVSMLVGAFESVVPLAKSHQFVPRQRFN